MQQLFYQDIIDNTHLATPGASRGANRKNMEIRAPVLLANIARLIDSNMVYTCQLLALNGYHVFAQLAATARQTKQNAICGSAVGLGGAVALSAR